MSISKPLNLSDSTCVNEQELGRIDDSIRSIHQESFKIENGDSKDLSVPIIDTNEFKKYEILKQGWLICTRIERWYKKSVNLGEIELKKTRLRWRRFKAILYPDRLELYHTNKIITTTKRLAYTIYLNKGSPYRPVKLSLVSPQDFIWSLEYLHYERKSWISFHFLSTKVSDAQEWYMLIYQQLPNIIYYKKPIPSYVDIQFMQPHASPVLIRLPLQPLYCSQVYIPVDQLKSMLAQLLNHDLDIPINQLQNIKLCWQPQHVDIKPLNIPWINELDQLIIPPLIEQTHQLQLYLETPRTTKKVRNYDGIVVQKIWSEKRKKFRDRHYYALVFGHHLFFFDGPFYNKYKKELRRALEETSATVKNNWFHLTSSILSQQRKIVIGKHHRNETMFKSAPLFNQKRPTVSLPDPLKLFNSHYMIDLRHQVARAHASDKGNNSRLFEIELNNKKVLYYEAPNTQIMLQWITMINNSISVDHFILFDPISYKKQSILLSGEVWVKEDYHGTFKRFYCLLSKDEENQGIMLFRMNDRLQQYEKYRFISLNEEDDYIYSGDECILDKLVDVNQVESYQFYANDQLVTGQHKTSDCVFVIWQMKERHFVPTLREYMSFFKFGHRLGNRGKYWIFKARNKQERDEWIWALHYEKKNKVI